MQASTELVSLWPAAAFMVIAGFWFVWKSATDHRRRTKERVARELHELAERSRQRTALQEKLVPAPRREALLRWQWDPEPDLPYPPPSSMRSMAEAMQRLAGTAPPPRRRFGVPTPRD